MPALAKRLGDWTGWWHTRTETAPRVRPNEGKRATTSDRRALFVEELSDEQISAIERAKVPAGYEHLNAELTQGR
jgi:hypothetical protein